MRKITEFWHEDAAGVSSPHLLLNTRYFHPKSGAIYRVVGVALDAQREVWVLRYTREDDDREYIHTVTDFLREGRFLKVKEGGL